jgi:hypothetical protein
MGWSDIIIRFLNFLDKPNALGALVLLLLLVFLGYMTPIAAFTFVSLHNTERLETVIGRNTDRLESSVDKLGQKIERVAYR